MDGKQYDTAISFAGEDRSAGEELANALKKSNITVFFDEYEKANLWGKDLYEHLSDVYKNRARFCVMFLSEHYAKKLWTNLERKAAQARAFMENREYILPIRIDETEIEGILPTVGYLRWQDESVSDIVQMIAAKLGKLSSSENVSIQNISDKNFLNTSTDSDTKRTRIEHLRDHLKKDAHLLKEYEDLCRLEEEPRRLAKYKQEINRLKLSISDYENQLRDLRT